MNKPIRTDHMTAVTTIIPSADNLRSYRNALGQFATGITIVTARTADGPVGMTANSFNSVSLEPPLVLWCLAKESQRRAAFEQATAFGISVLRSDQYDLAMRFAREGQCFTAENSFENEAGLPLIRDALANFECRLERSMDAGDHEIILGRVEKVSFSDGDPLVFQGGRFGTLMS